MTDGGGRRIRDGGLGRWLESIAPARARGEVAVALATDARVRTLNRQYRRKDQTTDVLAFPSEEPRDARPRQRSSHRVKRRAPARPRQSAPESGARRRVHESRHAPARRHHHCHRRRPSSGARRGTLRTDRVACARASRPSPPARVRPSRSGRSWTHGEGRGALAESRRLASGADRARKRTRSPSDG